MTGTQSITVSAICILAATLLGCRSPEPTGNMILLVPGVGGDIGYGGLIQGLKDGGVTRPVIEVNWGAPMPLFFLNFSTQSIHHQAEEKLARRITEFCARYPEANIDLIGHSAGCGVVLGALSRLPPGVRVRRVVLLAPSVSPAYDLAPSAGHVAESINAFHSERDTLFLAWRTKHFGTYDAIKTEAAGNRGFDSRTKGGVGEKLIDHPYEPEWELLGNDGGHFGCLSRLFSKFILSTELR